MKHNGVYENRRSSDGKLPSVFCWIQNNDEEGRVDAHYHEYIEILYVLEGENNIWLSGNYYKFKKGDLVVINSEEVHKIRWNEGKYIVAQFLPELLFSPRNEHTEFWFILPFLAENTKNKKIFTQNDLEGIDVKSTMLSIESEFSKRKFGSEMAVKILINSLFLQILRYWDEHGKNWNMKLKSRL